MKARQHGPVRHDGIRECVAPGDIDSTAEEVRRAGGRGIAVRCDHTVDAEVAALFARVRRDEGRLDVLVNNAWGGHESFDGVFEAPFWRHPLAHWDAMFAPTSMAARSRRSSSTTAGDRPPLSRPRVRIRDANLIAGNL